MAHVFWVQLYVSREKISNFFFTFSEYQTSHIMIARQVLKKNAVNQNSYNNGSNFFFFFFLPLLVKGIFIEIFLFLLAMLFSKIDLFTFSMY